MEQPCFFPFPFGSALIRDQIQQRVAASTENGGFVAFPQAFESDNGFVKSTRPVEFVHSQGDAADGRFGSYPRRHGSH